jgi:hypothetical protein
MEQAQQHLKQINKVLNESSRFISLSGLSGIGAGIVALIGTYLAHGKIQAYINTYDTVYMSSMQLQASLLTIAAATLISAIVVAFGFTYWRSKHQGIAIFGYTARKLTWHTIIPMTLGAIFTAYALLHHQYALIIPFLHAFYGLGVLNGSKYTLGEVKYIGYANIIISVLALIWPRYNLYWFATGFGLLHIIYGAIMWWQYERNDSPSKDTE